MKEIYEPFIKKLENLYNKDSHIKGCDMSDLGNLIGLAVAHQFNKEMGFEKDDFISGIQHGISLVDGTH